jgi:aminoglycoside phosphotransferase (APT) family kinase protein
LLLPRERRALYERLLDQAPRRFARYQSRRDMTIVNGDAHVLNTLLPRDSGSDDVRFLDWDSWRIGVGATDLAYMMAVHWYPDRRQRVERMLLDHYHESLVAAGVRDYDRGALDDDYRWSVLWQITTPMWQAVNNIPPVVWWNNLERIMLAVDDLDCRALLG